MRYAAGTTLLSARTFGVQGILHDMANMLSYLGARIWELSTLNMSSNSKSIGPSADKQESGRRS